jgi:hypothetical protein
LGKIGIIKKIHKDNDLKIEICDSMWTFNSLLVKKLNTNGTCPSKFSTVELNKLKHPIINLSEGS